MQLRLPLASHTGQALRTARAAPPPRRPVPPSRPARWTGRDLAGRDSARGGTRPAAGGNPTDAWLDLASFVAGGAGDAGRAGIFDDLASRIGKDCYIDVAGWHLYLRDVKVDGKTSLAAALAAKLGSAVADGGFKKAHAEAVLAGLPVRLGGGKASVPLSEAIPSGALNDLWRALEDFERGK